MGDLSPTALSSGVVVKKKPVDSSINVAIQINITDRVKFNQLSLLVVF